MTMRQVAGATLIVVGVVLVGWAVQHRHDPLVAATPKTVEPIYYGESLPLLALAVGLNAFWCGWLLCSTRRRMPPDNP